MTHLRPKDVDLKNRHIHVHKTDRKNNVTLIFPLLDGPLTIIKHMLSNPNLKDNDRIWPYHRTTPWKNIVRISEKAGIRGGEVWNHLLRHTLGTGVYTKTHDLRLVQAVLGHANIQSSAIYASPSVEDVRTRLEALETI